MREEDGRPATPDEQEALARWSGWGALQQVFDEEDDRFADQRAAIKELLGSAEAWSEARRTTINAHYTDPNVASAVWDAARALGFEGGRVLEPGCGAGNFMAYAPEDVGLVGIERDRTSAAIAQLLYPDADIRPGRFEDFDARTPFDLAIGNVPFAKVVPHDARYNRGRHTLHNYFLLKSLRMVRPGGLLLALTSRYTLDARNPAARRELAQHGDLLGALRLPSGAMRRTAGTEAIMDLLVLRRREPGQEPAGVLGWDRTVETPLTYEPDESTQSGRMNAYLADHPERVLGQSVLGRGMYGDGDLIVRGDLDDIGAKVAEGLAAIIENTDLRYVPAAESPVTEPPRRGPTMVGDIELVGERLTPLRRKSFVTSRTGIIYQHEHDELVRSDVPRGATDEVRHLIGLRDHTVNLLKLEADDAPNSELESARTRLQNGYERYVQRWGPLNRVSWQRTGRIDPATGADKTRRVPARLGGFRQDPEWTTLAAIEVYDDDTGTATPAAIQHQRVIHPPTPRLGADTADEALAISLDETGTVDLDRVAELLDVERDTARAEIEPLIYEDPTSRHLIPAEEYLSGDVRAKLVAARSAAQQHNTYHRNADALAEVQPAQLSAGDITVRPGVPWVPPSDVQGFAAEILSIRDARVKLIPALADWEVKGTTGVGNEWSTGGRSAAELLEACLQQRLVRVYRSVGESRVIDAAATAAAREKQEQINERFSRWVWEDPERSERLANRYNELFNSYVPPDYESRGHHLTFPGLAEGFVPHNHQRAAVARILREGRSLLGHAVGAGKTATMVIAGMELRRIGIVNQPAYVVPNHMLEQFSRELLQLYPSARVLIATKDITGKAGRKEFVARAATGDWDAVVITHSAFERLPLRQQTYKDYVDEQAEALSEALSRVKAESDSRMTVKRLENAKERLEARHEAMIKGASRDDGVSFEETGIDFLFIDELHLFKNKTIITGVEGVSSAGSRRATDLDSKLWHLHRANGARSIVGATATPIANAISEAWVMQTYIQPDVLADAGLDSFDGWAATFAQQVAAVELAPDGGSYRVTSRLARYQNVPELIGQMRRTADIRVRGDLDLDLPRVRGDAPQVVIVPASDQLEDYVQTLVRRAENIRNGAVRPTEDNMLSVTGDGRRAALDLRLVGRAPDPDGGKIAAAAKRVARIYAESRDLAYLDDAGNAASRTGGFQLVFCDIATPKDDGSWNAYDELKRHLVAEGLPPNEVAFIHDAKNDEARAKLFAKCRSGQIAVLLGSTEKMGIGTNIHTRALALHHLDCPWRPADIEQREGRLVRQGNQSSEVQIVRYATEGSFDVYMWQTCERKAGFIGQLMRGDAVGRDLDEADDATLSFAEVKALASGNPLVIEQAGVQADLAKYERLEFAHREEQMTMEATARTRRENAAWKHRQLGNLKQAIERRIDTGGDKFSMTIDGQVFRKRTDAAKAVRSHIDDALRQLDDNSDWVTQGKAKPRVIGELGGFPVKMEGHRFDQHREIVISFHLGEGLERSVRLSEDLDDPKLDLLKRLEHPLRRLDKDLEEDLAVISVYENEADELEARLGQPFEHRERLAGLRKRHDEILTQLNDAADDDSSQRNRPDTAEWEQGDQGSSSTRDSARGSGPADPFTRLDDLKTPPDPDDPPPDIEGPHL